jgi:hypothetical protein
MMHFFFCKNKKNMSLLTAPHSVSDGMVPPICFDPVIGGGDPIAPLTRCMGGVICSREGETTIVGSPLFLPGLSPFINPFFPPGLTPSLKRFTAAISGSVFVDTNRLLRMGMQLLPLLPLLLPLLLLLVVVVELFLSLRRFFFE